MKFLRLMFCWLFLNEVFCNIEASIKLESAVKEVGGSINFTCDKTRVSWEHQQIKKNYFAILYDGDSGNIIYKNDSSTTITLTNITIDSSGTIICRGVKDLPSSTNLSDSHFDQSVSTRETKIYSQHFLYVVDVDNIFSVCVDNKMFIYSKLCYLGDFNVKFFLWHDNTMVSPNSSYEFFNDYCFISESLWVTDFVCCGTSGEFSSIQRYQFHIKILEPFFNNSLSIAINDFTNICNSGGDDDTTSIITTRNNKIKKSSPSVKKEKDKYNCSDITATTVLETDTSIQMPRYYIGIIIILPIICLTLLAINVILIYKIR